MFFENEFVGLYLYWAIQSAPTECWLRDLLGDIDGTDPDEEQARLAQHCTLERAAELAKAISDVATASRGSHPPGYARSTMRLLPLWFGLTRSVALDRVRGGLDPQIALTRFAAVCAEGERMILGPDWDMEIRTAAELAARVRRLF